MYRHPNGRSLIDGAIIVSLTGRAERKETSIKRKRGREIMGGKGDKGDKEWKNKRTIGVSVSDRMEPPPAKLLLCLCHK